MKDQVAAANHLMERFDRRVGENPSENPGGEGVDQEYQKFVEFCKSNPPNFRGTFNPDKVEEWIKAMENFFFVLPCFEQQKVAFTTYMLEADTKFWWVGTRRLLEHAQTPITWEVFKNVFYEKYFPASVRNAKELEFMRLQQGNMSVFEYAAKFKELCKFLTINQHNLDKVWKCIKFEGGLREDILASVRPMEIQDYVALVSKCKLVKEYNKLMVAKSSKDDFRRKLAS